MIEDIKKNIDPYLQELENHPLYKKIDSLKTLAFFMERHIYSVWDFMSLVKRLQATLAPTTTPWFPPQDARLSRFINEVVLAEESDQCPDGRVMSHFELYGMAMKEVRADSSLALMFCKEVQQFGYEQAITKCPIPESALQFMNFTRKIIESNKPHLVAASFAFGREHIIPLMFQSLLNHMNINRQDAPLFYFYLDRHIDLDGHSHGPMAEEILKLLCGNSEEKWNEAKVVARESIIARLDFWRSISFEIFP